MAPVAQSRVSPTRIVVVAVAGVVAGIGLVVWIASLTESGRVEVQLGDDRFDKLDAAVTAEEIAERGPLLFGDVAGGDRPIYVQHLGGDHERGWTAFDARAAGSPDGCFVEWESSARVFVDACDDSEYPADGEGLRQYPATVDEDRVVIDLNFAQRSTTTSTIISSGEPPPP